MTAPRQPRSLRPKVWCAALVAAALAVLAWSGSLRMLDPTSVTWINADDPLAHVMGWEQFRTSPLVQFPITKNEGYGLERSSSLVYSDSIPIAALVLRPLSPILPHPFQYLGWWTVLSLVLQGYWGARLIRLRTDRNAVVAVGAGFFMVTPVLLNRIGIHTALTSHWLILCALWLYFSSREAQARRWAVLQLIAISIHAYLFVMIAAIWAAHLVKCRIAGTVGWRDLLHAGATLGAVVAWMACLGYFVVGKGAAAGGGLSRFDLINFVCGMSWNTLLPVVYGNLEPNAWDGYAYLGTGLMAIGVASAAVAVVRWRRRGRGSGAVDSPPPASSPAVAPGHVEVSWIPLIAVACGFLVFAATNHVLFDGHEILAYPWPGFMDKVTATFRGAGRMIWPTYYAIVLMILWFVIRSWPRRFVVWLLAGGLVLQVIDFREGARLIRVAVSPPGLVGPLRDPIWATIPARYHKMVSVPAFHGQPDRHVLGWFCAAHGIGSNIGYFGRMTPGRQARGAKRAVDEVLHGTYDPETVYSFPNPGVWSIAKLTASPRDLVIVADGHHLLLPGANSPGTASSGEDIVGPAFGTWASFAAKGTAAGFLLDGWSWNEAWGTWSDAKAPAFILPIPHGYRGKLRVTLRWLGHAAPGRQQATQITFDETEFHVVFDGDAVPQENTFDVMATHAWISVELRIQRPVLETDGRSLGVGLMAFRLSNPDDPAPPALDTHPPP